TCCTTTRTRMPASRGTSPSASSRITGRPVARSPWNISTTSDTRGTRRISPRPATCSSAWSSSSIATLRLVYEGFETRPRNAGLIQQIRTTYESPSGRSTSMYRQRPDGDLTGFTGLLDVVAPKALELLIELPTATIVALLTTVRKEHCYVGAVFRLAGSPPIMEASH